MNNCTHDVMYCIVWRCLDHFDITVTSTRHMANQTQQKGVLSELEKNILSLFKSTQMLKTCNRANFQT